MSVYFQIVEDKILTVLVGEPSDALSGTATGLTRFSLRSDLLLPLRGIWVLTMTYTFVNRLKRVLPV